MPHSVSSVKSKILIFITYFELYSYKKEWAYSEKDELTSEKDGLTVKLISNLPDCIVNHLI